MTKKMSKADKAMLTVVILIIILATGVFISKQGFKPFAITSGNLDYIKGKCGISTNPFYNVYQCGSYYCIDSYSGRCVDVDINCKNAPVVYNCLNLGGGTGGTATCSDTDNGKDTKVKGFAKLSTDSFGKQDYCSSETNLVEYYCSNNQIQSSLISCQNGCSGGTCLTTTSPSPPSPPSTVCGDGICDSGETQSSCSSDCIPTFTCYFCKNGILESGKWQGSCPSGTSTQQLSCETKPICTQEIGQLCNPTTKILGTYTDGCIKQSFVNDGYISDLSKCTATPPTPPENKISSYCEDNTAFLFDKNLNDYVKVKCFYGCGSNHDSGNFECACLSKGTTPIPNDECQKQ